MKPENMLASLKHRFESRYTILENGCWEWNGKKDHKGYGRIGYGLKQFSAHRISLFLVNDAMPSSKLMVCHKCDNRLCVNPEHLFLGTAKDNTQDAKSKGRLANGERHGRKKLTLQDIEKIKASDKNQHQLATDFGVGQPQISRIKTGKNWGNVA